MFSILNCRWFQGYVEAGDKLSTISSDFRSSHIFNFILEELVVLLPSDMMVVNHEDLIVNFAH